MLTRRHGDTQTYRHVAGPPCGDWGAIKGLGDQSPFEMERIQAVPTPRSCPRPPTSEGLQSPCRVMFELRSWGVYYPTALIPAAEWAPVTGPPPSSVAMGIVASVA